MSESLYCCLLQEDDSDKPFFQLYWAYGERIGLALDAALAAAVANGLRCVWPASVDPASAEELDVEVERAADGKVLWSKGKIFYPPNDRDRAMRLPPGVILSGNPGDFEAEDIQPGYEVVGDDEYHRLEINVPAERLRSDYGRFLEAFEPFRVFWYKFHDHWDEGPEELYTNESLSSAAAIQEHLDDNQVDSLRNGLVTLTAYLEDGATNISITDHRKIVAIGQSAEVIEAATLVARRLGYRELEPFITVDRRMFHWHYRPSNSRSRTELIDHLVARGFGRWK